MNIAEDSTETLEHADFTIQQSQSDKEDKIEENIIQHLKPIFREWETYFNEDFDIYSINNGIEERPYYSTRNEEPLHNEVIQLEIENGHDFSFKLDDDGRVETEGNLNIRLEEKKQDTKDETKLKEDNSVILEKNENDYMTEDFLNDEDFAEKEIKDVTENKQENKNQELKKENLEIYESLVVEEENKNSDNSEIENKKENIDLNCSSELSNNIFISSIVEINENIDLPEVRNNHEANRISVEHNNDYNQSPEEKNKILLKNKDNEIKNLNDRLNTQKFQNKIIIDENNKLLEVISIFRMLQNLENENPTSRMNQTSSNFKETKLDPLSLKGEINREFYNTYSNNDKNNMFMSNDRNFNKSNKFEEIENKNEIPMEKDLTNNRDLSRESNSKYSEEIVNFKEEKTKIIANNRYNSNKSDINNNILNISQSPYNSNKSIASEKSKCVGVKYKEPEIKVPAKTYIAINPIINPGTKSSYGAMYKGKTGTKGEVSSSRNQFTKSNLEESRQRDFIKISSNSFGDKEQKISKFEMQNNKEIIQDSYKESLGSFKNQPLPKSVLRAMKKTETEKSLEENSKNVVRTIPINMRPIDSKENKNNLNFYDQSKIPLTHSRPLSKQTPSQNHSDISVFTPSKEFDEGKINLKIINNIANTNNINNFSEPLLTSYEHLINLLEKYREMNDKLISCLNKDDFTVKIDTERRKQDVENLEQILEYINSVKDNQERSEKEHVIPFYLIDKRKLYENIVNYIYHSKDRPVNTVSSYSKSFRTAKK